MLHAVSRSRALTTLSALGLLGGILAAAGCGAGQLNADGKPNNLYDKTFAGQNACNPKNAERPFIIDWDATDQSSFQAQTQGDVVFVQYKGCDLKVLTGCRDDSVKASVGSYKAVEWTSGGVEVIDIKDQGELYAKLPLGAGSLGGRVESGEKFHMEYFVAGTRTATRDHVYKAELAKNPACATATHFVYQYNLGAFALASASKLKAEVNGSYFGFGGGASKNNESSAEKKGGDLATCKGESATEVEGCKVPIRLTLREITDGNAPEVAEAKAPETDAALNLAGKLKAENDQQKKAEEHMNSAQEKLKAKDGNGCLAELDAHDKLDSRPSAQSTNYKAYYYAITRAQCLMLAGKCDAGKELYRKTYDAQYAGSSSPEAIDMHVEGATASFCQGGKLGDRDTMIKARTELMSGAYTKKIEVKACLADIDIVDKLRAKVKPKDTSDVMVSDPLTAMYTAGTACLANAGDCDAAYKNFKKWSPEICKERMTAANQPITMCDKTDPTSEKMSFEMQNQKCKGKLK